MYPDLSYILHDLIGTNPDNWTSIFKTFGLLLVLAILSASWILYLELKRKAEEGIFTAQKEKIVIGEAPKMWDVAANGLFGFLVGWKGAYIAQNFAEFQLDPAALLLSSKGNILFGILATLAFAAFRYWEQKKEQLPKPKTIIETLYPHDKIGDITVVAAISGIFGAKLFSILEEPSGFFDDPIGMFFSGSGLTVYGGFICGYIGVHWFLRKHKIPFLHFADAVAPALIISYGVGRIGCQLAGDGDWGIVAAAQPEWWMFPDWLWSFDYPRNVNNDGLALIQGCSQEAYDATVSLRQTEARCAEACGIRYCHTLEQGVYPTPLYEIVMSLIIGGILWALRKRITIPGMIFFIYLIFNGVERFFIEKIRVNVIYKSIGLTQAELISAILFLIGIGGVIWLWRKGKR